MPSQRRTLPETTPEPEPTGNATGSAPASAVSPVPPGSTSAGRARGYRACKSCKHAVPASSLLHGECPDCAGLQPLPLRGEGGRFLPGLTTSRNSSSSTSRQTGGA
jgi:hypothetical protein